VRIPRAVYRASWVVDRVLDRVSGGRFDEIRPGPPTLRLTTRGRTSGARRENGVYYLADGERLVVVASNAGSDRDPGWWRNLQTQPDAEVRLGQRRRRVRAREATPEEAAALRPRLDTVNPRYAEYRAVSGRPIPIIILEPRP
jgi:deazaflavin-dependent oxidoreductase (nitroreductase family)